MLLGNSLISVIMPVYKAEKTLNRAVDSVLSQTFSNFEIILVDDCSPDDSGRMADEISSKDKRVIVLHNSTNLGPGGSRNAAIDIVRSDYIIFIDSDDFIEPDFLQTLYNAATVGLPEVADIVFCGYSQDHINKNGKCTHSVTVLPPYMLANNHHDAVKAAVTLDSHKCFSFAWNKLLRRAIIEEHNIRFSDMLYSEDTFFTLDFFKYVNNLISIQNSHYHYIKPAHDTLSSGAILGFWDIINKRFSAIKDMLMSTGIYEGEFREKVCNIHVKHIISAFERDCWPDSGFKCVSRYQEVKKKLSDENTKEALEFCKADSRASKILNAILKTNNAFVIFSFSKIFYIFKKFMPVAFNKVK